MPLEDTLSSIGSFSQGMMKGIQQSKDREQELSHKKELLKLEQDKIKLGERELELKSSKGGLEDILKMLQIQTEGLQQKEIGARTTRIEEDTRLKLEKAMREDTARGRVKDKLNSFTTMGTKPTPTDLASFTTDLTEFMEPSQAINFMKLKGFMSPDDKEPERIAWTKWTAKQLGVSNKEAIKWITQQQGRSQFVQAYVRDRVNADIGFNMNTRAEQGKKTREFTNSANRLADSIIASPGVDEKKTGSGLVDTLGSEYDDIFNVGD